MPFINGGHIWLILALVVVLVIFGPGKLPELGAAVGKTIHAFRRSTDELKAEMNHKSEPVSAAVPTVPVTPAVPAVPVSAVPVEAPRAEA